MLLMWNQSYSFYVNSIVFYNKVTNKFNVKKKKKYAKACPSLHVYFCDWVGSFQSL